MQMVSMKGYQAYIMVATYDQEYVNYLSSKPDTENYTGFLKMGASRATPSPEVDVTLIEESGIWES